MPASIATTDYRRIAQRRWPNALIWGSPDHPWAAVSFLDTVTLYPSSYAAHRAGIDWWQVVNLGCDQDEQAT